jgi:hypothetical protein
LKILRVISRSGCADLSIFPTPPDDAIVVVEEESMIDGLKLAITGEELILALNERIERHRSTIQFKRDQISGKIEPPKEPYWDVPAETVEDEIRQHQHRIHVLMMIRDHILTGETYLVGRRDLAFAELMPDPPEPVPEWDPSKPLRWVPRSVESDHGTRVLGSPGD